MAGVGEEVAASPPEPRGHRWVRRGPARACFQELSALPPKVTGSGRSRGDTCKFEPARG